MSQNGKVGLSRGEFLEFREIAWRATLSKGCSIGNWELKKEFNILLSQSKNYIAAVQTDAGIFLCDKNWTIVCVTEYEAMNLIESHNEKYHIETANFVINREAIKKHREICTSWVKDYNNNNENFIVGWATHTEGSLSLLFQDGTIRFGKTRIRYDFPSGVGRLEMFEFFGGFLEGSKEPAISLEKRIAHVDSIIDNQMISVLNDAYLSIIEGDTYLINAAEVMGISASEFNSRYCDPLDIEAWKTVLERTFDVVTVLDVPGQFEVSGN